MLFRKTVPQAAVVFSLLAQPCCPIFNLVRDTGYSDVGTTTSRPGTAAPATAPGTEPVAATTPAASDDDVECALCAGLGLDVSTDAAVIGLGFVADGVLPSGFGAEANIEFGQGSGEDSGDEFLGKTAGFGSDYHVMWLNLHGRYPVQFGDNEDMRVVPLAGISYYRWTLSDCEDPFDAGFCDAWTTTSLDVGAELQWRRFGFKAILPIGDGPDMAFRLRYHLPVNKSN